MKDIIFEANALTKQYPGVTALDHVNMKIRKGEIYGFIGQNGAGKTTLIRLITSLIAPSDGEMSLFGRTGKSGLEEGRKRIGSTVETPAFYPRLTAEQNLEYYRIQRGIPERQAVSAALKAVNLTDTGKKKYSAFSLGMKQRLGLALAIMGKPDFLILDEPINGLDPTGIIEFRNTLKDLVKNHGMTILISSHNLPELSMLATTFGIIHNGRLIREISQEQLEEETKRCIALKVDDAAKAAAILKEKLNTDEFEVLPEHELRVYAWLDNPAEVNFQLSTNGIRIHSAMELGTSLEDYFMETIGEQPKRRTLS